MSDMCVICGTGNCCSDGELKYVKGGDLAMFVVDVATNNYKNESSFIRLKSFGAPAENMAKFIGKGRKIAFSGKFQIDRDWET